MFEPRRSHGDALDFQVSMLIFNISRGNLEEKQEREGGKENGNERDKNIRKKEESRPYSGRWLMKL